MDIKLNLFISSELPNKDGYTWTINSRLGDTLKKAEELFGERDKNYTILGVEFVLAERPQVWYPGNCKQILIQLSQHALIDVNQALYQLSHETIHCLSPNGKGVANVLEEGLATYFSESYFQLNGLTPMFSTIPEYNEAIYLVKQLLAVDMDIIKKVRLIQPTISDISVNNLLEINSELNKDLLEKLCQPFY